MRQSCIELTLLYVTMYPLVLRTGIESEQPFPIFWDIAQSFFAGLMLLRADSTNWTMLFDFKGVKAMISLAAATTIQKIADSKIAIILWLMVTYIVLILLR